MTDPGALLDLARSVAEEAGALARRRRAEGVHIAATKSSLADIVTAADREVEELIRERLNAERPDDGFLGEESGQAAAGPGVTAGPEATAGPEVTWIVDPIDGTVNYAQGIPHYAVSIAAVTGPPEVGAWDALAGVVFNPTSGELFTVAKGTGAYLGSERLAVSTPTPAGALLATGFAYAAAARPGDLDALARALPLARDLRRMGAASLDLAYVAAGRLDAYFERGLHAWDHAAGALMVTEAGGRMGYAPADDHGRPLTVATTPSLFDDVWRAAVGE